ncbi:hypothetical protein [Rhodococcus opacus]|uniref:hypothetical protein n=1 Tax=Rhodococcus opacus TaxID=37919 RepID=UPI002949D4A3|nr:hypothetical protein [Rhodococcus opacus]MDV6246661.1 hypothetical protein [Rhodococcus opacus]
MLAHIGFLPNLRQLYEGGVTQKRLAEVNGDSQPAISQMLQRARVEAPDVRPGTHGGTLRPAVTAPRESFVDRGTHGPQPGRLTLTAGAVLLIAALAHRLFHRNRLRRWAQEWKQFDRPPR